jgi:uncharacterized Zn finger protein
MDEKLTRKSLAKVISRSTLKLLAGGRAFVRGENYRDDGLVELLSVDDSEASAIVRGTSPYHCRLKVSGESLRGECDCPAFSKPGSDAEFCKHLVAMGLAIAEPVRVAAVPDDVGNEVGPRRPEGRRPRRGETEQISFEEIQEFLSNLSREKLISMLMSQAMSDDSLLRSLRLEVLGNRIFEARSEVTASPATIIESIKKAIDQGVEFENYGQPWPDEYEVAGPLDDLVEEVRKLLEGGLAAEVVKLAEYFLAAVEPIVERFHEGARMVEILERLQEIHLIACQRARPDPESLGRKLFRWELSSGWGVFADAPKTYASVLGEVGQRAYRELAEAEWAALPPDQKRDYGGGATRRYSLTNIMENLAKSSGDVEAEVAIHARHLASGRDYLKIAEIYLSHQNPDKALEWAERGLKSFADDPGSGVLRRFLAKEYQRRERHGEALDLLWVDFVEGPSLESFRSLKDYADVIQSWPKWRQQGLELLQAELRRASLRELTRSRSTEYSWNRRDPSSTLVRIYLWEQDSDAAWRQAVSGGVDSTLWRQLAKAREQAHPADAVAAYRRIVDEEIERGDKGSYREAVKLVVEIEALMKQAQGPADFAGYLHELRTRFKAKRNFIKLLDTKFERP